MAREKSRASGVNLASIDIGTHTARLLITQVVADSRLFRPVLRQRAYIRLAEDFAEEEIESIKPEAIDRALKVLEDFASTATRFNVRAIRAVSTGVVRKASNKDRFVNLIYERTGIRTTVISGEEEARLTGRGVLHSLSIHGKPFIVFDLGGGTTEFLVGKEEQTWAKSIPLGAMVLTQKHLTSDPPEEKGIKSLEESIAKILLEAFPRQTYPENDYLLVGTGGTVATLAAMIHRIETNEIGHDNIHGLVLRREGLEDLFAKMRSMTFEERLTLPGLDRGRADVIVAGSMVVMGILRFFRYPEMLVSFSDMLEGILIEYLAESST
ncbi:MAG: hypothetical protein PVG99_07220 [Desulfobacteraceae bacterium]|jgi:exopolyphosphatase/guanosine-5'-triphosphate,3'-diphosphate pyrophosphatase